MKSLLRNPQTIFCRLYVETRWSLVALQCLGGSLCLTRPQALTRNLSAGLDWTQVRSEKSPVDGTQ